MGRFDQLIADHKDAEFKTYEMLAMNEKHWLFNWVGPTMMLSAMEMAEKKITD